MKIILVPTDFSDAAKNAAEYAVWLAREIECKVLLFHAYHIPMPASDTAIMIPVNSADFENENTQRLEKEAARLRKINPVQIDCLLKMGFVVDEIMSLSETNQCDLIVLGMKNGGVIEEYLVGSTVTSILTHTQTPILVVPENTKYSHPSKIAFACDYSSNPNNKTLDTLKNLARQLQSSIYITNVHYPEEKTTLVKEIRSAQMDNYFGEVDHSCHFVENDNIIKGINDFIESNQIGMLAMIPHKHHLWEKLFKKSDTKKMAFHTIVPLLILPEN